MQANSRPDNYSSFIWPFEPFEPFESANCEKEGKKITKNLISWEQNELFRSNKKRFLWFVKCVLLEKKKKIEGISFKSSFLSWFLRPATAVLAITSRCLLLKQIYQKKGSPECRQVWE